MKAGTSCNLQCNSAAFHKIDAQPALTEVTPALHPLPAVPHFAAQQCTTASPSPLSESQMGELAATKLFLLARFHSRHRPVISSPLLCEAPPLPAVPHVATVTCPSLLLARSVACQLSARHSAGVGRRGNQRIEGRGRGHEGGDGLYQRCSGVGGELLRCDVGEAAPQAVGKGAGERRGDTVTALLPALPSLSSLASLPSEPEHGARVGLGSSRTATATATATASARARGGGGRREPLAQPG